MSKPDTENFTKVIALLGIISGLVYNLLGLYKLLNYQKQIKNRFSFTEKISLNWLFQLSVVLLAIWLVGSVTGFLVRFFDYPIPINWLFAFVPLFIFYLGFYGIKQKIIYSSEKETSKIKRKLKQIQSDKLQQPTKIKYGKSNLRNNDMERISTFLSEAVVSQKLYLNPTLTLSYLSAKTNIPEHHITQTLNEYCNQNFHDFVNQHRVEEFKNRVILPENSSYSLLGIAFDCGFNSKASFNRIFKKFTSQTPSEYKKKVTVQ